MDVNQLFILVEGQKLIATRQGRFLGSSIARRMVGSSTKLNIKSTFTFTSLILKDNFYYLWISFVELTLRQIAGSRPALGDKIGKSQ